MKERIEEHLETILQTRDLNRFENFLLEYGADVLTMQRPNEILMQICDDPNYIKSFLANPNFGLTTYQKEAIIASLGDDEFRDACIRGEVAGVELEPYSKARLYLARDFETPEQRDEFICDGLNNPIFELDSDAAEHFVGELSDAEKKKGYIRSNSLPLDVDSKLNLIAGIGEDTFSEEIIGGLKFDTFSIKGIDTMLAVSQIKNPNLRKVFIKNNLENMTGSALAKLAFSKEFEPEQCINDIYDFVQQEGASPELINEMVNDELYSDSRSRDEWNAGIKSIATVSELDLEQLENSPDIRFIRMDDKNNTYSRNDIYTREKYKQIRGAIDKVIEGIPVAQDDNPRSQLETFSKVFSRLSNIKYDNYAVSPEGRDDKKLQTTCRNLEGGLLEGKCVCVGYSEILKNALSCVNVEAITVGGKPEGFGNIGHAWNQVRIGDHWLNCDLTNSRETGKLFNGKFAYRALKTDKQFSDHDVYKRYMPQEEHSCNVSISQIPGAMKVPFSSYIKSWGKNIRMNQIQEASREVAVMEQAPMITAQELAAQQMAAQQVAAPPQMGGMEM